MTTLINTPNGNIGRALAEQLLDAGEPLVLIQRSPEKVADLAARGARVVAGSTDDPAVLARAFEGVGRLFWLTPPVYQPDFVAWAERTARAAVDAAKQHGVRRAGLLSSVGAHSERVGPVNALARVEAVFRAALEDGVFDEVVALRPAFFLENLLRDLGTIGDHGAFYAPLGEDTKIPMVATRDIAATAAEELRRAPGEGWRVRGVHGPADLSHREVAETLSRVLEREVRFVSVPEEAARKSMGEAGMPGFVTEMFLEMYEGIREGRMSPQTPRSAETTTPTDLATFAREVLRPALG